MHDFAVKSASPFFCHATFDTLDTRRLVGLVLKYGPGGSCVFKPHVKNCRVEPQGMVELGLSET